MDADAIANQMSEPIARGDVILFTGAGFSVGATNARNEPIPQVRGLKEAIWALLWPEEPVPDESTLQDTFAAALGQSRNRLKRLLLDRLRVLPTSVSEQQRTWLSMPWRRVYTLNIDDLENAAARQHELPRSIRTVSALAPTVSLAATEDLPYVHLNGTLDDVPDVTFAEPQYGARHGESNPLYEKLAADLMAYSVVFVGTELHESLFWQYVALRDSRGPRGTSEMRPRSYLVTPTLSRDRQALLRSYNIEWIKATADEFADQVLDRLQAAAERGHKAQQMLQIAHSRVTLPKVADLASQPEVPGSEYLIGAQPQWADITSGRAMERNFETAIRIDGANGCLVVAGTAGAGTSTVLKRLALRAMAHDQDVRWIDANHSFTAYDLSRHLRRHEGSIVLVIDDADTFGHPLAEFVEDFMREQPNDLLILGMRASKIDAVLPGWRPGGLRQEVNVPRLEDSDIDALLEVLERNNRLGALKPMTSVRRREAIRNECGRELLVAMIEATSGKRFEQKIADEFTELPTDQKHLYGIVSLASELRFPLARDEIIVASGTITNSTLYALDRLVARKLLLQRPDGYAVRHRRIAELVVSNMRTSATVFGPYQGLLRAVAIGADPSRRTTRESKLLTALLNHDRIWRMFSIDDARQLYDSVEEPLRDDYHYWLQRGSLEVEHGNLPAARLFLQHAFAGGQHDFRVQTEWAYLLIKTAYANPRAPDATELVEEAEGILLEWIDRRGTEDSYAYHVYGSQLLAWLRRAPLSTEERGRRLEVVKNRVKEGTVRHPYAEELQGLYRDLENDWLSLAVPGEQR